MNLLELQEEYNEKQLFIKLKREKIELLNNRMKNIHATNPKEINVKGSPKRTDLIDMIYEKSCLEEEIKELYEELGMMLPIINELEKKYKALGERDKQIYIQRKIYGLSPVRIGIKWELDERTIRRIVEKVEKKLQMSVNVRQSVRK